MPLMISIICLTYKDIYFVGRVRDGCSIEDSEAYHLVTRAVVLYIFHEQVFMILVENAINSLFLLSFITA